MPAPAITRAHILLITIDDVVAETIYLPADQLSPQHIMIKMINWAEHLHWSANVHAADHNLYHMAFHNSEGVMGEAWGSVFTATRH